MVVKLDNMGRDPMNRRLIRIRLRLTNGKQAKEFGGIPLMSQRGVTGMLSQAGEVASRSEVGVGGNATF